MKKIIVLIILLNALPLGMGWTGRLHAQRVVSFPLSDVTLLHGQGEFSKWYDNQQLDSAWMMSFPVKRLLHNFQTTAGVFAGLEGGYSGKQKVEKLGGWESMDCDLSRSCGRSSAQRLCFDGKCSSYGNGSYRGKTER